MPLIGAIAGDILGSRYEFANFRGSPEELVIFPPGAFPTDDTVLTCAVAKALLDARTPEGTVDHERFQSLIASVLRKVAGDHGSAGYGALHALGAQRRRARSHELRKRRRHADFPLRMGGENARRSASTRPHCNAPHARTS